MHATDKPFKISKKQVYDAYKAVKSNAGAAGVDGQTIEQFEANLGRNLYKIWNRMSSGSYFPPSVRAVSIPKKSGGQRILGVPTVADRVAQMVVKQFIEPNLAPMLSASASGREAVIPAGVHAECPLTIAFLPEAFLPGAKCSLPHQSSSAPMSAPLPAATL